MSGGKCKEIRCILSEPFEFPDGTFACDVRVTWAFNGKVEKKLVWKKMFRQDDGFARFDQMMEHAKETLGKILRGESPCP